MQHDSVLEVVVRIHKTGPILTVCLLLIRTFYRQLRNGTKAAYGETVKLNIYAIM